ncbi:4'-phosphopantetheinyl transferase superfamily protein [Paraburkholderia sp. Ac-20336]|uniref:4'-phosphopantetheinyl transferase family protein n=1 Tax=Paraburkholderia sp. Ac-20336 TaxID=2703886 RepID=UPI001980E70A|nr:4'-phosphopantetheinyl transferase superfamily protein [Paraburkholderia sp. Ac-20336]MBN3804061.1 4'-phosphopantetheinyl transferase superfamily protein [Paraburkholderia sp. Ac-20336]
MLDIWCSLSAPALVPCLSDDERQRRDRFSAAVARKRYERAHSLKRLVLARYGNADSPLDLAFTSNNCGKPQVVEPFPYRFNLSHSGDCVAIAVSAVEVGVDVEWHRPILGAASLARLVFNVRERRWLERQPCFDDAFFRLWTLKEALLKAAGTGFSRPPRDACWQDLDETQPGAWYEGRQWTGLSRKIGCATLAVVASADCAVARARLFCIDGASGVGELYWTEMSWKASQSQTQRSDAL